MKIRILTIFLTLTLITYITKTDWQPQTSGINTDLFSVCFVNENTGWAVGSGGKILSTTNGGNIWGQQVSNTANTLFSVDFPSQLIGFAVGTSNTIVRTTNGGAIWTAGTINGISTINDVGFADINTGYVCGSDGKVGKTTNGGVNWTVITVSASDFVSLETLDANTMIVGGVAGTVYKTTNGGNNWSLQLSGSSNYISSLVFSDNNNGYLTTLGLTEEVKRTTNGGTNWLSVTSPGNTSGLNCLAIINSSTVYGAGSDGAIRRTTNSGSTWETQPSGDTTSFLRGIFMVNANVGYIVGNSGKILKTVNGGIGIHQISSNVPSGYNLSQNYPNPFNPVTNIEFSIPKNGFAKLIVFDVSGKEIAVLVNENLSIGTYRADFDAGKISSGIYFYRLETNSYTETKKMILVK